MQGDIIQLQGGTQRARITRVDYEANEIELDRDVAWTQGLGLSLAYEGAGPDIGAHEAGNAR